VRAGRLLRLAPAAMAAYELRYLITHLLRLVSGARAIHVPGGPAALGLILVVAATGLLLRESGRGLSARAGTITFSLRLLRSWLVCSAGLGLLLVTVLAFSAATASGHADALAHAIGLGNWFATGPAVLVAGLLLALSVHGARWLLARVRSGPAPARRGGSVAALGSQVVSLRLAGAPLRAGWSDRGPPRVAPTPN